MTALSLGAGLEAGVLRLRLYLPSPATGGPDLDTPSTSGGSLGFRIDGGAFSVDPETSEIRLATAALASGVTFTMTVRDAGGQATGRWKAMLEAVTVGGETPGEGTIEAPVLVGTIDDQTLLQGAPGITLEVAQAFAGEALVFSATGGGAAIDAATGRLTLSSRSLRRADLVTVTATNAGGQAQISFLFDVVAELLAPVAIGTLPAVVWPVGSGSRTLSAAAGFAGEALVYALEAAPAGATIEPATGLLTVPTESVVEAAPVRVRASNAAGSAVQTFTVTTRLVATVFDNAAALAEMTFLAQLRAPAWSFDAGGFARLVPFTDGVTHGVWSRATGDGTYRALVRWSAASTVDRPFSLSARLGRTTGATGTNFTGLRLDCYVANGATQLDLRQYTGALVATTPIAAAPVSWNGAAWAWVELELEGVTLRARVYGETETAPAWQVVGTTEVTGEGAVGIGGLGRFGASPQIDVKRIEFRPLIAAAPLAAGSAEWSLEQWVEQSA